MVKKFSKILLFVCVFVILVSVPLMPTYSAVKEENESQNTEKLSEEEKIKELIKTYFDFYFESFKTLKIDNSIEQNLFEENDDIFVYKKSHESQIEVAKKLNGYKNYNYNIEYDKLLINKNTAEVELFMSAKYVYGNMSDNTESGMGNISFKFKLINNNGQWKIAKISSDHDNFRYFEETVNERIKEENINKKEAAEKGLMETKEGIRKYDKLLERQLSQGNEPEVIEPETTEQQLIEPQSVEATATYPYNASNAVKYAQRYATAKEADRVFYTTSNGQDCTNFASQCVWAAYGGYVPDNDPTTISNITNRVRMVNSVWQGGLNGWGGYPNWEQVLKFYTYTTGSKTLGPKGKEYNNNAKAENIISTTFRVGDVLQVRDSYKPTNTYTHSVYITKIYSPATSFYDVFVSQHGDDLYNRSLYELFLVFGGYDYCYMRGIRFSSASFAK